MPQILEEEKEDNEKESSILLTPNEISGIQSFPGGYLKQ